LFACAPIAAALVVTIIIAAHHSPAHALKTSMEEQIVAATTAGVGFFTVGYQVLYGVEGLLVDDRGDRNLKPLLPGGRLYRCAWVFEIDGFTATLWLDVLILPVVESTNIGRIAKYPHNHFGGP
jgi:hypothetical protein